jgi:hypothetical protein
VNRFLAALPPELLLTDKFLGDRLRAVARRVQIPQELL